MLFWTFCLLSLLQAIAGIVLNMFALEFFADSNNSTPQREEVYRYYGTFTRSFLTLFEIMFANLRWLSEELFLFCWFPTTARRNTN